MFPEEYKGGPELDEALSALERRAIQILPAPAVTSESLFDDGQDPVEVYMSE